MHLISIGTDRKLFEKGSKVRERIIEYGKLFEKIDIIVFSNRSTSKELRATKLSENVTVYPTNSKNKLFYLTDALKISKTIIHNPKFKIQNPIVSCQDPFETGIVGLVLKWLYKLPLQVQIHTDFYNKYFFGHSFLNKIRFLVAHLTLPFADGVRVVSQKIADSIKDLNKNAEVLPIFVDEVRDVNYEIREEKREPNILAVCRLEKEKDLSTAIKAFKIVLEKFPEATFTIVGDGSLRQSLEVLSKSLEVERRVRFVGWREDTKEYYQNADIYVSTSLYEGYGMSMVEAGSFGVPLVISDTGVAGSIFKNEESAFVCKQRDILAFANVLEKLVGSKDLRKKMGEKAKESVQKNILSKEEYLAKYREAISSILDSKIGNNFFC